jgi:hypothetical protein
MSSKNSKKNNHTNKKFVLSIIIITLCAFFYKLQMKLKNFITLKQSKINQNEKNLFSFINMHYNI